MDLLREYADTHVEMAWWITVYCRRDVGPLDAERLHRGITDRDPAAMAGVDYMTLAEDYGIDDDALAEAAASSLVVTEPLEVTWEGNARPLVVHRWSKPERVAEELDEANEVRAPPHELADRVKETKEIFAIELGFGHLEPPNMGVVFAYEIARYVAQLGDGLIVDDDDHWQVIERGAFTEA